MAQIQYLKLLSIFIILLMSNVVIARPRRALDKRANHRAAFNYFDPDNEWPVLFETCEGKNQSPINIELEDVKMATSNESFQMRDYDAIPKFMTLINNGHSVKLSVVWPNGIRPRISGGPLRDNYIFGHLHFHWGAENDYGSEHTVANHSFPLEMHMVHYKESYQSFEEAIKYDDGIAVVGYLFSLDINSNTGLEMLRMGFPDILEPKEQTVIYPFQLTLLDLDLTKEGFITYIGSLTTPPCTQNVIWILSVRIKDVSADEMNAFRTIKLNHGDDHNYRPVQPRNGRPISYIYNAP